TTRWRLIVEDLTSRGYHVSVITGTKQIKEDNNIIYVGNKSSSNVVNQMREKSRDLSGINIVKKLFYNILKKIYRAIVRTFAWPDYSMFWLLSIYKNKKRLNLDYDLMISVSLPFSSHIAAYILNKKNKKEWVMDIGDPFTLKKDAPENNRILYGLLNRYYENKFYSLASKIIFTHEEASSAHIDYFDIETRKTYIGNPISNFKEEIYSASLEYNYNSHPKKFGYFGVFTKGVRSPKNFMNFFKDTENIEFHWYVNDDSKNEIASHNKELNSIFHSIVEREEALKLMAGSFHCLVSIGNLNTTQIPSKVIEYISTGKPVIHFCEVENDPVKNIANEFQNLFIISETSNKENLLNQLNSFYKDISTFNKKLFIEKYTSNSITEILN
ncbi:MAG: hypothetical protein VYA37_03380, partial [Actinomycetota bacterium]|nr:hypothetical protein [Actinomycetota bacterium]